MDNPRQKYWAALAGGAVCVALGLQGVATGGLSDQASGPREIDMTLLAGSTILSFIGYYALRWALPRLLRRAPRRR